jgi:hypothetical protein
MKFNITAIKAALQEAGHVVSEGENLAAKDLRALFTFAHFHFNISEQQVAYGLQYPSTLPKSFPGHPDAAPATTTPAVPAPAAAPVAVETAASPVEAPAAAAAPAATETPAPATEPAVAVPAPVETAPVETPAPAAEPAAEPVDNPAEPPATISTGATQS